MNGTIISIWRSPASRAPLEQIHEAHLVAGSGLMGDRYFATPPGLITFIEEEMVAQVNREHGLQILPHEPRRNIVTRGVPLNDLVGVTFRVGDVSFRGVELCEPCSFLGTLLATPRVSPREIIAAFMGRGGLRAEILSSGMLTPEAQFATSGRPHTPPFPKESHHD